VSERGPDVLDRLAGLPLGSFARPLQRFLVTEQGRYLAVAGTVSVGYLALLAVLLSTGLPYMIAITIAQAVAISCAFPAYRVLVFRSTAPWRSEVGRFVSVWAGGAVAGFVVTPIVVELSPVPPLAAQVAAVVVVAVASYLGHRYVSFRHRGAPDPDGPAPR
jgi:putative flippase GtrA